MAYRERERVVIERKENEREGLERRRKKKRREKKKGSAFAQHLPDYSFRRPGGFTRMARGCEIERMVEREREREGRENRESSIDPGYVHICKYIYPGSTGLLS